MEPNSFEHPENMFVGVSLEELEDWIEAAWKETEAQHQTEGSTSGMGGITSESLESPQTTADNMETIGASSPWNPSTYHELQFPHEPVSSITVSSVFGVVVDDPRRRPIDIVLISSDSVAFYVDEVTLLDASANHFNNLLPVQLSWHDEQGRSVFLQDIHSSELEIMLQCIYNVPGIVWERIGLGTVIAAIDRLPAYGVRVKRFITRNSSLFKYLSSQAPIHPLECYTLAAYHDLHELAVDISPHTLVCELSDVTVEMAERMGPHFLLKLLQLHTRRVEALKELLSVDLGLHPLTKDCSFEKQRISRKAWSNAVVQLSWHLKANIPTTLIREIIVDRMEKVDCDVCIQVRDARLAVVLREWSLMTRTI